MATKKTSAGLLMYRHRSGTLEVFIAHPGGPYARNKDAGAWSIPKGEIEPGEDLEATAVREFAEEIGIPATGPRVDLGLCPRRQVPNTPHTARMISSHGRSWGTS